MVESSPVNPVWEKMYDDGHTESSSYTSSTKFTDREKVIDAAHKAVIFQRNNSYGPPTQDFSRSAALMNALGFRIIDSLGTAHDLDAHHVALIQMCVKMSRISWSPDHFDSWTDIAGYAACGYECATYEKPQGIDE